MGETDFKDGVSLATKRQTFSSCVGLMSYVLLLHDCNMTSGYSFNTFKFATNTVPIQNTFDPVVFFFFFLKGDVSEFKSLVDAFEVHRKIRFQQRQGIFCLDGNIWALT